MIIYFTIHFICTVFLFWNAFSDSDVEEFSALDFLAVTTLPTIICLALLIKQADKLIIYKKVKK